MKKFILCLCGSLAVFSLAACVLIFVPFSAPYGKGPKVEYRVEEGAIDVFSLKGGQISSLFDPVLAGEALTVRPPSDESLKIPFWLSWTVPVTAAAVERANLFMYKQSKKARYRTFSVGYTDKSILRGFTKEIEKTRILSNVRMNFLNNGFTFFARIAFIPVAVRGYASTGGADDKLFLRLRWVKIGNFFLPKHVLRALENVFLKAYVESRHPSVSLLKITFSDEMMLMSYRKEAKKNDEAFQQDDPLAAPEIIYPSGD
jgi:hypothetical protein